MHGTLDLFQWTAAKVDDLKRMIEAKYSSSQAASALMISRGAVMGKAYRLGFPFRSESKKNSSIQGKVHRKRVARKTYKVILMAPEPDARNLTFDQLQKTDCRYVVTADHPMLFCGHSKADGSSYCAHHHHVCWTSPPARNRDARPR